MSNKETMIFDGLVLCEFERDKDGNIINIENAKWRAYCHTEGKPVGPFYNTNQQALDEAINHRNQNEDHAVGVVGF